MKWMHSLATLFLIARSWHLGTDKSPILVALSAFNPQILALIATLKAQ